MEWIDTGVSKQAIGIPTDEDLNRLKEEGYTHMCNGETKPNDGSKPERYEIWLK